MSGILKAYEEYKKSNLPWLHEIPSHWELTRNKNVMKLNKDVVGKNHVNYTLLSLTKQGIIPRDLDNAKGKFPKEFDSYQVVSPLDMVFCLFDIDETPRTVGLSSLEGMITGAYTVFKPQNINEKYLYYYYLALDNNKMLKPLYTGLRKVINTDTFLRTYMPYPSIEEQDKIVKYLDINLSKINKLVKAKKKQVLLLKEQKQAIIDSAITKGINKNVTMKCSGIEWIGNIPESWEVRRIKSVATVSPTISQLVKERSLDDKVVFLPMDKISSDGEIDNSEWRTIKDVKTGFTSFAKNDVVVAKITPCFENGKGACLDKLASDFGYGTTELIVLRASEKVEPKYLYYITRISQFRILGEKDMTGSAGQKRVPTSFVGNFTLGIPKREEQIQIIEHIEKKKVQIENVIQKIASEIELISEYKNSLISSVVTGKFDVRDIQINEEIDAMDTDESEELEFGCECDSDLNEIEGDK